MTKLITDKGYRLIGVHMHGFNAFFMHKNVGVDNSLEVSVEVAHDNAFACWSQINLWPKGKHLGWQKSLMEGEIMIEKLLLGDPEGMNQ